MSNDVGALETGEAADLAVDDRDQGQHAGEALAERRLIVGARGPGLALLVAVILGRQLVDRGAENLRAAFCVGGQIGAKGLDLKAWLIASISQLSSRPCCP